MIKIKDRRIEFRSREKFLETTFFIANKFSRIE